MVRVTLDYLDPTKYGIWLTLSSFLGWFSFFEIGLGNGLRNKLAEALARKDYALGKVYVSTTYAILTFVIAGVALLFFIANHFIDWSVILNTDGRLREELSSLALIVFGFFFLRFVVKLIGVVLFADQRPALANFFNPLANLIALIVIYILTFTSKGSLLILGFVLSAIPVLVLLLASLYLYTHDYRNIAPSVSGIKLKHAKSLLNLGVKFFLIQIAGLIIYQSSNIIIAQFFGPDEVTVYNIAFKYFSSINMLFTILITPFWGAFTEAWVKKDVVWIKGIIRKLLYIWFALSAVGVAMLVFAKPFYAAWVGNTIEIPFNISLSLYFYFITFTFGGVFVMFINGVGKVKLQMYASFIGAILFIVLAITLIKYTTLGVVGLVLASIISNFYGIFLTPIQYKKIINNTATGIWNK